MLPYKIFAGLSLVSAFSLAAPLQGLNVPDQVPSLHARGKKSNRRPPKQGNQKDKSHESDQPDTHDQSNPPPAVEITQPAPPPVVENLTPVPPPAVEVITPAPPPVVEKPTPVPADNTDPLADI